MVCSPLQNSIDPPITPPIQIPSYGILNAPIQIPSPELELPTQLIEDLLALVNQLGLNLPGGLLKPNPDGSLKSVLDFIANLFNQFAPFLSFYNLMQAAFNMFKCIIEVLCAIPNPFAVANKLKILFTQCLPPFLNLFPPLALITMIISFLLLLLALIEYIITTIIGIIEDIIKNVEALSKAISLNDPEASLAAVSKIASLLCIIQNVLAILTAIQAIIAIIETLAKLASGTICSDEDQDGCCPPQLCPPFIKNTPNGIEAKNGKLLYLSQIGVNVAEMLNLSPEQAAIFNIPPIRRERWQVYDTDFNVYPIHNVILSIFGSSFWPDELPEFTKNMSPKRAPYTVDLKITINPNNFGITDILGERKFTIKDCIVVRKPHIGIYQYDNSINTSIGNYGVLDIEGGLIYEEDGTPYKIGDEQATLNTLLHKIDSSSNSLPNYDDSLNFDVEFIWKPNAPSLAGYQLTTVGCIPEVNLEKATQNAIIISQGIGSIQEKLPPAPAGNKVPSTGTFLPNVFGTLNCVNESLTNFRNNISLENAALFQANIETCLNDLKNQTTSTLCAALIAAVSTFRSEILVSPEIQFASRSIKVSVLLKDNSGVNLGIGIPNSCANEMAKKLTAEVTFGDVTNFDYDSSSNSFIAKINSENIGKGSITVLFDNKVISKIINGVVGGENSKIEEIIIPYEFNGIEIESPVRRNESDIE